MRYAEHSPKVARKRDPSKGRQRGPRGMRAATHHPFIVRHGGRARMAFAELPAPIWSDGEEDEFSSAPTNNRKPT